MARDIKALVKSNPLVQRLLVNRKKMRALFDKMRAQTTGAFPPGHFYSPIPSMEEVHRDQGRIFDRSSREIRGVDLNVENQLDLLDRLKAFYEEQPFSAQPSTTLRYYFENGFFGYADALILYGMIRYAQPKRIIEMGSGFSSFVMLDTNERFFNNQIQLTFVEPYDERLRSRLKAKDPDVAEIVPKFIQELDLARFDELTAGDIVFVDSSHIAKIGSDVNHILFEILPRLASGVFVHFHDVFYPFEYPEEWIEEGRFWNEDYILRAFLQFNSAFKIRFWNRFIEAFHSDKMNASMPLCTKDYGSSLWLERA